MERSNEAERPAIGLAAAVNRKALSRTFALSLRSHILFVVATILLYVSTGVMVALAGGSRTASLVAAVVLGVLLVAVNKLSSSVTLGADGVTVRWLESERFVSFADVGDVHRVPRNWFRTSYIDVQMKLSSGETFSVPFGSAEEAKSFEEALNGALTAFRQMTHQGDTSVLGRGERTPAEWVAHLRSVGAGAQTGHRHAAIDLDRLLGVAADPTVPQHLRVSAAIAAMPALPGPDRVRIRAIGDTSASPQLRSTFEKVADAETSDEALARMLAELEAEASAEEEAQAAKAS